MMFCNDKMDLSMTGISLPTEEKKNLTLVGTSTSRQLKPVSIRWSSPDRTHGCERRRRILCNIQWASQGPGRWLILSSSGRYLWRTPPAYPQGSLAPHLVSYLLAADVCSLQEHTHTKKKVCVIKMQVFFFLLPNFLSGSLKHTKVLLNCTQFVHTMFLEQGRNNEAPMQTM